MIIDKYTIILTHAQYMAYRYLCVFLLKIVHNYVNNNLGHTIITHSKFIVPLSTFCLFHKHGQGVPDFRWHGYAHANLRPSKHASYIFIRKLYIIKIKVKTCLVKHSIFGNLVCRTVQRILNVVNYELKPLVSHRFPLGNDFF